MSASIITLLSETLKLSVAIFFLHRSKDGLPLESLREGLAQILKGESDLRKMVKYALPAALYLINNLIYYAVLPLTTPSLLQVCILAKLPTTGILHHYAIKRQENIYAWFSLLFLCIGLAAFNVPSSASTSSNTELGAWYLAPVAGFSMACLSAWASISSETATKEGNFWESQAYLYTWGVVFAMVSYLLIPSSAPARAIAWTSDSLPLLLAVAGVVTITAVTGLVVAAVLRARDNILKVVGTAASLLTIAVTQFLLFPNLRESTFSQWKVLGGGIVTISTWCYNFYSQEPWPKSRPVDFASEDATSLISDHEAREVEEADMKLEEEEKSTERGFWSPNSTKIVICALCVVAATFGVSRKSA